MLGVAAAKDFKAIFNSGMENAISPISDQAQLLKFGYSYDTSTGMDPTIYQHLGVKVGFEADLAGGYGMPFNWLHVNDENFLAFNPNAYIALAVEGVVQLKLYWIEWQFTVVSFIEKFTPFDYQALWSLDNMQKYCHSINWAQDFMDLKVSVVQRTMECQLGFLGFIPNSGAFQALNCFWHEYYPVLPVWSTSFVNEWDWHDHYLPWTCTTDEDGVLIDESIGL